MSVKRVRDERAEREGRRQIRWRKVGDRVWRAKHDASWIMAKDDMDRWRLYYGEQDETSYLGTALRKRSVNAYLLRRLESDEKLADMERKAAQAAEAGVPWFGGETMLETVELPGCEPGQLSLRLEEERDEVNRRAWIVYLQGWLLAGRRVRCGVLVEHPPGDTVVHGGLYLAGADHLNPKGIPSTLSWDQALRHIHATDPHKAALQLARVVLERGAIYMSSDCYRRDRHVQEQEEERAQANANASE